MARASAKPCAFHGVGMSDEYPKIPYPQDWSATGYDDEIEDGLVVSIESYVGRAGGREGPSWSRWCRSRAAVRSRCRPSRSICGDRCGGGVRHNGKVRCEDVRHPFVVALPLLPAALGVTSTWRNGTGI